VSAHVRKYAEAGDGWFVAFVDTETGILAVQSDYGDWGYRWGATGTDDLRKFLVGLRSDYLSNKFLSARQLYGHAKAVKDEQRRISAFLEKVWPRIVAQMKAELAEVSS